MAGFIARGRARARFNKAVYDAFQSIGRPNCQQVHLRFGTDYVIGPDGEAPRDLSELQDLIDWLQRQFGPAFDVHWRTRNLMVADVEAGLFVRRLPSMTQLMHGIPTGTGRIMVQRSAEPEWLINAREIGWETVYDRDAQVDGSVGVSFELPRKIKLGKRWPAFRPRV